MYIKIKVSYLIVGVVLLSSLTLGGLALAGEPDSPGEPSATSSYSLEDLYNRLNAGTVGSSSVFTEPTTAPGTGTMHSINEIMAKAPVLDNTSGATTTHVLAGQTFWGLTASQWATQTGTMTDNGAVTITPTTTTQTIALGYHNGNGTVIGDSALDQWNIRSGATIFGVTGKCHLLPATGQTTEYESGDDGAYQYGCRPVVAPQTGAGGANFNRTHLPWSSSWGITGTGFVDAGNGTVTDTLTGLVWLKDANCFGGTSWANALTAINGLADGSCGLSDGSSAGDWRMPNLNEFRSLIDPGTTNPPLPSGHPFTNLPPGNNFYYSSTTDVGTPTLTWGMMMETGSVQPSTKAFASYVWPVRGGQ